MVFVARFPIRSEAGDVLRWFGTNTDVTEQIEAENALRVSVEQQTATADVLKAIALDLQSADRAAYADQIRGSAVRGR